MISFGLGKDGETPEKASMCLDIATFSLVSYTRPFMCPASLCEPYAFPPSFWYSSIILSILCCSHFSSFPYICLRLSNIATTISIHSWRVFPDTSSCCFCMFSDVSLVAELACWSGQYGRSALLRREPGKILKPERHY